MARKKQTLNDAWYVAHWRPLAALVYLAICLFDFIVAPIIFSVHSSIIHSSLIQIWQPMTLQGGGIFHLSFGAILGVSAYSHGQEKMCAMNNDATIQTTVVDKTVIKRLDENGN